jgi:hypothetical protein
MRRRDHKRGQSLVEFAVILPVFILLLVGFFDFGHVVWANNAVSTATREAARFAIVHGGSINTECPVGPSIPDVTIIPNPSETCPFPSPSKEGVKQEAMRWMSGVGGTPTISVCYGEVATCAGDVDAVGATNARGTPVTVTITTTVNLAAPSFFGIGGIGVNASSTMLVNH